MLILATYPINFAIYCFMCSTFRRLFFGYVTCGRFPTLSPDSNRNHLSNRSPRPSPSTAVSQMYRVQVVNGNSSLYQVVAPTNGNAENSSPQESQKELMVTDRKIKDGVLETAF